MFRLLHVVSRGFTSLVYVFESCSSCLTPFKLFCTLFFCVALVSFCGSHRIGLSGSRLPPVNLKC